MRTTISTLFLLAACSTEDTQDASTPTYRGDVAPILQRHCAGCHTEGAIAPFPLDTYEGASDMAPLLPVVTAERTMPPVGVDASGECNSYRDASWLSDEELDILARWADAGAPEGDAALAALPEVEPPQLEGTVLSATMPAPFTPPAGSGDVYRCFDLPVDLDADAWVTGFEVQPGFAPAVHHVVVWTYDPERAGFDGRTNAELVAELDGADGSPGWDCLGVAGGVQTAGMPGVWTPGTPTTKYPVGTGLRLGAEQRILLEMHYYTGNGVGPDQTTARLELRDSVEHEAEFVLVDGLIQSLFFDPEPFVIPPGEPAVEFTWEADIRTMSTQPGPPSPDAPPPPEAIDIYGVFPHMHQLGTSLHAELLDASGEHCVTRVPAWDFAWQKIQFYDEPLRMTADQIMRITCEFDSTSRTTPTAPGFQTANEMCTLGAFVVRR